MEIFRQPLIPVSSDRKPGISVNIGLFLLLYSLLCSANATPPETIIPHTAHVYAVQLESSRNPNLNDYSNISNLGTIYTYQDSENKELIRVRIGYYTNHQSAKQAQEKIRTQGFHDVYITKVQNTGKIYNNVTATEKTTRKSPQKNSDKNPQDNAHAYTIQLESSYRPNLPDYEKIRKYGAVYTKAGSAGKNFTYVRMGNYNSHAAARQMLKKIRAEGFHDAYIIRTRQVAQNTAQNSATPPPLRSIDKKIKTADKTTKQTGPTDAYLYTIHVTTTDNPDMEKYDIIQEYGVVYMVYRYSRKSSEKGAGKDQIRIMAGYYENPPEAEEALNKIKAAGFDNASILRVPDRSKIKQKTQPLPRSQPKPTGRANAPPGDNNGASKRDPFSSLEKLDSDPFE